MELFSGQESRPQGLKPRFWAAVIGTAEAVPFQKSFAKPIRILPARNKALRIDEHPLRGFLFLCGAGKSFFHAALHFFG